MTGHAQVLGAKDCFEGWIPGVNCSALSMKRDNADSRM